LLLHSNLWPSSTKPIWSRITNYWVISKLQKKNLQCKYIWCSKVGKTWKKSM
jgi:hypothetical protein